MKWVSGIVFLVFIAVLGLCLYWQGVVDVVDGVPGVTQEPAIAIPTYLSFVSAMMTAVTAVVATVAVGVGLLAFFTFRGIEDRVTEIAEKRMDEWRDELDASVESLIIKNLIESDQIRVLIAKITFEGTVSPDLNSPPSEKEEGDEDFDSDDTEKR